MEKLSESINWKKPFWINNFAKTFSTSSFITATCTCLIEWANTGQEIFLLLTILFGFIAPVQLFILDWYGAKKKKEELDAIDNEINERIKVANAKMDEILEKNLDERIELFLNKLQ